MPSTPVEIVENYQRLKADRSNYETTWQQIADYIRPTRADFVSMRSPGERRNQRIFDSTALMSADNFGAGIFGNMTSPANRWFDLRMEDDDLNEGQAVKAWLYDCTTRILDSFGSQSTQFYTNLPGLYVDLACFGTAVHYSEEIPGSARFNDSVRSVSECVIAEDGYGQVDTIYRRFSFTGKQALGAFGEGLSTKARTVAEKKPFENLWFIHCVAPNGDYKEGATADKKNRPFASEYIEEETRHLVARAGYYEFPYQVPRWSQVAGEIYGRGIGEQALPDVKMVNRQQETMLKAAQKVADPPLGAPDEDVIKAARTWPGGITYGAIDMEGRRLVQPLFTGGNTGITLEMIQATQGAIREAFYFSLMQVAGSPSMTATEWMGRYEEKLRLLGPNLGRIQGEFLSPLIVRRFGMLSRAGRLPPPPQEVSGAAMKVDYVSPLAKMQKAGEGQSIVRFVQGVAMVGSVDPRYAQQAMDNIDIDEMTRTLADSVALPPKNVLGKDKVEANRKARQQMEQAQQMAALADPAAKAVKNLAGASKDFAQAQAQKSAA